MTKSNYVAARPIEKRSEAPAMGEIMIPPFRQEQQPWAMGQRSTGNVDPFRKGLEFNLKYAPLAVTILILSVGVTMRTGQDFTWGITLFGLLLFVGYWILGASENFFDRDSGHVVWALFGWLVEWIRAYYQDKAHARVVEAETAIRLAQLQDNTGNHQMLAARRADIEQRHLAPQAEFNRLANYEPEGDTHPPVSSAVLRSVTQIPLDQLESPAWAKPVEKNDGSKALACLLDFVEDIYKHDDWTNGDGLVQVRVPWSKIGVDRSGVAVSAPVKRQIIDALASMAPPLFVYVEDSRQWKLNIIDYPSAEDAYSIIDDSPIRKVGRVG